LKDGEKVMRDKDKTSHSATTESEVKKSELILGLFKQGRITLNESRILSGFNPVIDHRFDTLIKKDK
jgi:hypothetical protein